jgi:hypothetical protein
MLLVSASVAGSWCVNLVEANPYSMFLYNFTITPVKDPPIVSLVSPINGTTDQNASIIFNVAMPESWQWTSSFSAFVGQIKSVTCSLDQTQILSNDTLYGLEGFFIQNYSDPNYNVRSINYTKNVGSLSLGLHNLTINVKAHTLYNYQQRLWYRVYVSATFTFMVVNPPAVTSLSLENATYNAAKIPLVFSVDETPSWSGYSLDNQANVTANGNVTLTGLTEGNHSLVIYANDTFGNMGKADPVTFNVHLIAPNLGDLISEPTAIAVIIAGAPIIAALTATGAIISFGLLAYFAKFKKKKSAQ